ACAIARGGLPRALPVHQVPILAAGGGNCDVEVGLLDRIQVTAPGDDSVTVGQNVADHDLFVFEEPVFRPHRIQQGSNGDPTARQIRRLVRGGDVPVIGIAGDLP